MRKLKSFSALRSFEAAARHLSFKMAAEELFVTPTAVSHQIRTLENELDCRLFERKIRQVQLTLEGHELFTSVRQAFDNMEETATRISSRTVRDVVTLGLGPIIGARWLAPRLGDFWFRHPDIDLRLHHSPLPIHQRIEQFDLAIAWGDGHWPAMVVNSFIEIKVTPVLAHCGLFEQVNFTQPSELLQFPLIHQRDRKGWYQWLASAGVEITDLGLGTIIEDSNIVLQTALDGQGIILGILPFIEDELVAGRLSRPFDLSVDPGRAYYLIHQSKSINKPAVRKVRDWLLSQIEKTS